MAFNNATPEHRAAAVKFMAAHGGSIWTGNGQRRMYFNDASLEDGEGVIPRAEMCRTFYLDMTTDGAWKFCNKDGAECAEFGKLYYKQMAAKAKARAETLAKLGKK